MIKKDIKLSAAAKTSFIEVNTPSNNHAKFLSFKPLSTKGSPVTQKVSQEQEMLTKWDDCQSQLF